MTPPAAATAAARARHAAVPAPLRLPPAPRRVSGPSRHPRAAVARPAASPSLVVRLIDHPWLERLVRGRAWIAIVATALLGIVAMQVALLRLGAQIGQETSAVNALAAANETAQTQIGVTEAGHRLSATTGGLGMVYPPAGAVTFLEVNAGDPWRAVHEMTAPSAAALAAAAANARRPVHVATTPATLPSTTTAAGAGTAGTAGTTAGTTTAGTTTAPGTTTAGTTTATGTTAPGTTTATNTTAAGTTAGTTTAGTTTATGTTASGKTTTAGTTPTGTPATPATTTVAGTTRTSGTTPPASTPTGAVKAPPTTTAGGTTAGG